MQENTDDSIMDDPTRPSLATIVAAGHAFSIPWSPEVRAPMACLDSSRILLPEGPWMLQCPFDTQSLRMTTILLDSKGGCASFRDGLSTDSGSSSEHLSAALGLTVGYPFLNASVTGQYDLNVLENKSGIRASRNTSCRLGCVVLKDTPQLSTEALALLKNQGPEKFRKQYGDFYVCGYELGADAGASLSASNKSSRSDETLTLTVAVKVLFFEESISTTTTTTTSSSSASIAFNGYSSLHHDTQSLKVDSLSNTEQAKLQAIASAYLKRVGSLDADARDKMRALGLEDGKDLPLSACTEICQSGLVVQLLLAPFGRLNDFVGLMRKV